MNIKSAEQGRYELEVSKSELTLFSNALNEVCNGVHFGNDEFSTRLGASRQDARRLLDEISRAL